MIISHKHQFIFLKTTKTAGTSIELALSRFCGPNDIITPLSSEEEKIRQKIGGTPPQNYRPTSRFQYTGRDWWKLLSRGKPPRRYREHMPARKIRRHVRHETWNQYFKFCVARNPWDRVISQYYWRQRNLRQEEMPSIMEFLDSKHTQSLLRKGFGLYTLKGQVAVDKICRYESLEEDLEEVRQHLGLPEPLELPKAKSGVRKDKRHYSDVLSEAEKDRIADLFKDEIKLMGYQF
ncbi:MULTISPECIES: sulfotransferase family 2 domain-containing protein [Halomonadaceae]|uniref:Chondroitin 4-O-sulfotransferase n=1 Tax=Vreelandella halophila TaxID=86177 RepID=A0A9X4YA74_9GAMM|nr:MULTISPECIES: sulfotransferase family 2 domain-containing protein [Halomonas]MYL26182.1 chondroitin 4-O-sulfotransferase [Halomonas utahensis]MYL73256.1 chondroitin 4-O-sulfotransferase [Halomonas sp. 22501_18_FS]